ncbi:outer membrane protein [Desulfosediminicola sp.]|uniref:outer membrane protein n=1 Tax=Desulfosediminicola sp. TaxID=2886825 RepID=UPI003AF267A4
MRKKILAVCFLVSFMCFCSIAQAGQLYTSGHLGVTFANDADVPWGSERARPGDPEFTNELDAGYGFLAAVGYDFDGPRVEVELGYQKNSFDEFGWPGEPATIRETGDLSVLSMMVNGYYDFHNPSNFTPYLTAGLGFAYVEWTDFAIPDTGWIEEYNFYDTVFAYQFGAGVEYAINEALAVDLRYRYLGTGDIDVTAPPYWGSTEAEFSSHNIYLGLRYFF